MTDNLDRSSFAERIRSIRTSKGLTGRQVAEGIGIKYENYRKYETSVMPKMDVVVKLADFYNMSVDRFIGRDDCDLSEDDIYAQIAEKEKKEPQARSLKCFDVDYGLVKNDFGELSAMEMLIISNLRAMESKERMRIINLIINKQ